MHRYLASMGLVQKTLVARFLQSHYAVALIERRDLGGVDLILDHHTAVVYVSLPALPSDHRNLLDMLTSISWRYS
ncbi:hypothetical protein PUNSTDRAFT_58072, partial [Punctularia strigosozonata HHB-11173 SS5]|uniref:uncharacterized protein n=1 Tax=Punctularia strigosozonata (strain HHB-11173) TaxID=741275 RepID=UPI00044179E6